jgi:hypothetical protein
MTTRVRRGIAGLPGPLPEGERLIWQGAPDWRSLARHAYHVRKVAVYFGILIAWFVTVDLHDGQPPAQILGTVIWLIVPAVCACALLTALAWLSGRTTIYTITDRRICLRYGIALSVTLNLPFSAIEEASLKTHADGTGDLALKIGEGRRIAYLALWPLARPWHIRRPEPMLRALPEPEHVARLLGAALAASAGQTDRPRPLEPAARPALAGATARTAAAG